MPDRAGTKTKRRRNRAINRQISRPEGGYNINIGDDDTCDEDEWASSDDDNDSWYSDESESAMMDDTKHEHHYVSKPKLLEIQSEVQPVTLQRSFSRFSYYHLHRSLEEGHLCDRQLPAEILTIFPNAQSLLSLLQLVKKLQDEEELFRSPVDERGNRKLARINNSFPRERLVQHFKQVDLNQFDRIDRNQMLIYIRKAVLKRSSYGVLVHNSKKEIFALQKFNGNWTAPRGYRKIKDSYQFETIREAVVRYFNEKIRVTDRSTNTSYQNYDVDGEHGLSSDKYVEYLLDDSSRGDKFWCIGLFLIEIDESKLAFELHDNHEYQACAWLNADDILHSRRETSLDKFHTLKPFVEHLQSRLTYNNEISHN